MTARLTLDRAWAEFKLAGLNPTNPQAGRFSAECPKCGSDVAVTQHGEPVEIVCQGGCDRLAVAQTLHGLVNPRGSREAEPDDETLRRAAEIIEPEPLAHAHTTRPRAKPDTFFPSPQAPPRPSSLVPSSTRELEASSRAESTPAAAHATGGVEEAEQPEVEWLLAEHAAGRREPEPVALPPLPDCALKADRAVAAFYVLVHGLRLTVADDRPVPFGCEWVAGKLGLTKKTVWRVRNRLVEWSVLVPDEPLPGRDKRGVDCYLPGALRTEDALPASTDCVESDRAGGADQRDEVGEDAAVLEAEADDRREPRELHWLAATAASDATPSVDVPASHVVGPPDRVRPFHGADPTPVTGEPKTLVTADATPFSDPSRCRRGTSPASSFHPDPSRKVP